MRCPKCNFVSYDLSETCAKCGKNISNAAKELQGTVAGIAPPSFLRFGFKGAEAAAEQGGAAEAEVAFDLGGAEDAVIDLGTEEGPSLAAGTLDLGGSAEEKGVAEETVFAMPTEESQAAGFEISDLAPPPEAVEPEGAKMAQELEVAVNEAQAPKSASAGLGLADLKVEGIDLEAAPAKGKVMPAVKTGTALDEFDIDLSELIPKKEQ